MSAQLTRPVLKSLKSAIRRGAGRFGYEIVRRGRASPPHYLAADPAYRPIIEAVRPYTMTSYERIGAVIDAARHISRRGVAGAVVECGVWRGGSIMAAAMALQQEGDLRDLYLFDTFAGMTAPTEADVSVRGENARERFSAGDHGADQTWCYASLEDVQRNLAQLGYPAGKIHFVKGDVLETLPARAPPGPIALLRLDTDWYESTRRELETLYGALQTGGVLIIDDYGHWGGSRKAVDEYFGDAAPLLCRIDYTGRIVVKP